VTDGKEAWFYPPNASASTDLYFGEPAVGEGLILIGSEGPISQFHGVVHALNTDRTVKWCRALDQNAANRSQCPLIEGGTKFSFEFSGFGILPPVDNRVIGGITLADGVAYFGTANNDIFALDANTGEVNWTAKAEGPIWGTVLVAEGAAYVPSLDHHLYAFSTDGGQLLWRKDMGASVGSVPAYADGKLFVGTFGNAVYALNATTGDEVWKFATSNWVWGTPVVNAGKVYFADLSGNIFAVSAESGTQLWQAAAGAAVRGSPALAGDKLIVGDKAGNIHFLNLADGQELTAKQAVQGGGQILSTPLVVPEKDLVLIATYQGSNLLTAYTPTGTFRWAYTPPNR
jgi:outer membrane protein assembly factor BamB